MGEHGVVYAWGSLSANTSMKDEYMYRLAGTYLLRAEAYLANNEPDKAMADLNELRDRARTRQLTSSSEVTLDFILDEQMRELYFEDFRVPTLCRLGKWWSALENIIRLVQMLVITRIYSLFRIAK